MAGSRIARSHVLHAAGGMYDMQRGYAGRAAVPAWPDCQLVPVAPSAAAQPPHISAIRRLSKAQLVQTGLMAWTARTADGSVVIGAMVPRVSALRPSPSSRGSEQASELGMATWAAGPVRGAARSKYGSRSEPGQETRHPGRASSSWPAGFDYARLRLPSWLLLAGWVTHQIAGYGSHAGCACPIP